MKNCNTGRLGFTLIELLVVVLIIGILATVALPQYQKAVAKTKAMQGLTMLKSIANAQDAYFLANGQYANNLQDLDIDIPGVVTGRNVRYNKEWSFEVDETGAYILARYWQIDPSGQPYVGRMDIFKLNRSGTIYCRAKTGDIYEEVCKSLSNGQPNNPPGYGGTWYIIE